MKEVMEFERQDLAMETLAPERGLTDVSCI
jgi:hypothetical protein